MTAMECVREADVLDAVASGKWPRRLPADLAAHVISCPVCRDLARVAEQLRTDYDRQWTEVNIPSSGQAWWRAEMRARQEAVVRASRPIAIAQTAAVLAAVILIGTTCWLLWTWSRGPSGFASTLAAHAATSSPLGLSLIVALCALAVLAPVAVYVVLAGE
jgi:hypothetical protein